MGVIATYYAKAAKARRARRRRQATGQDYPKVQPIGPELQRVLSKQWERQRKRKTQTLTEKEDNQASNQEEQS